MKFAAYTEYAIYGIGETPEAARKDASEWLDDPAQVEDLWVDLISDYLAAKVEDVGGNCGHTMHEGVLVAWEELESAR